MYPQAHAGLGWVIGVLSPTSDRKLRGWCTAAAILPDADAAAMLLGVDAYARWHHKPGHNIFLGLLCVAAATVHFRKDPLRRMLTATTLVALCFAWHLLTDMKLSGWGVYLFWPFGERDYNFAPNWGLGHPLNTWLAYLFMTLPWLLAFWKPATPLELLSARLNQIFLNAFRPRTSSCACCGRPCNNVCDRCGNATCMKDGSIDLRFRIACRACALGK
jgi:hypothetical protein